MAEGNAAIGATAPSSSLLSSASAASSRALPPSLLLPTTTDGDAAAPALHVQEPPSPTPPRASPRFLFLLQAVVVHHGSADGGHYTTYRRLSPVLPAHAAALLRVGEGQGLLAPEINTWVHASDDQVSERAGAGGLGWGCGRTATAGGRAD